jgi:hypothetical protein
MKYQYHQHLLKTRSRRYVVLFKELRNTLGWLKRLHRSADPFEDFEAIIDETLAMPRLSCPLSTAWTSKFKEVIGMSEEETIYQKSIVSMMCDTLDFCLSEKDINQVKD